MKDATGLVSKIANLPMLEAFHRRNYPLLFLSIVLESVGMVMAATALGWLVLQMTGSALTLGIVGAVRSASFFVLGLPAGAIIDKMDRRKVLILATVVQAVGVLMIGALISKGWI